MAEDRSSRREERRRRRNPAPPPVGLRRGPDGKVVLDTLDDRDTLDRDTPDRDAPVRADAPVVAPTAGGVAVGGPLRPSTTVHFGRPPGTENRPAGAAASVAVVCLLLALVLPWATRRPETLEVTSIGWRDADGAAGPAWWAALLLVPAGAAAVAGLAGRIHSWWRLADVATGAAALAVAGVELWRIRAAADTVAELSRGEAHLGVGPALVVVAAAGLGMCAAAALHRDDPPAWQRIRREQAEDGAVAASPPPG